MSDTTLRERLAQHLLLHVMPKATTIGLIATMDMCRREADTILAMLPPFCPTQGNDDLAGAASRMIMRAWSGVSVASKEAHDDWKADREVFVRAGLVEPLP